MDSGVRQLAPSAGTESQKSTSPGVMMRIWSLPSGLWIFLAVFLSADQRTCSLASHPIADAISYMPAVIGAGTDLDESMHPRLGLGILKHLATMAHSTDRYRCRNVCQPTVLPPRGLREGHIRFCSCVVYHTYSCSLSNAAHPCPVRDVDDQRQ